jgi:cell division protein FtsL
MLDKADFLDLLEASDMIEMSNILILVIYGVLSYYVVYNLFYANRQFADTEIEDEDDEEVKFAKNELRIKKMQDQIDDLTEHERIFDILITKLDERLRALETSAEKKLAEDTERCVGYVEYDMY